MAEDETYRKVQEQRRKLLGVEMPEKAAPGNLTYEQWTEEYWKRYDAAPRVRLQPTIGIEWAKLSDDDKGTP